MPEYIERDKKKIARLLREAQLFQDNIVCAVGTSFMQTIAEAENRMIFSILNGLETEPTADVVAVRHGVWKDVYKNKYSNHVYRCSVCGGEALFKMKANELGHIYYEQELSVGCPHCLAKMDGKGEGE